MSPNAEYLAASNVAVLKFSGVDTLSFLQGQLSNDVNKLENSWQYSGYCNPKGRLLALLQLWKHGKDVYATIDKSIVEVTTKRLRMYVMRSNVVIDELEAASCVGVTNLDNEHERFSVNIDGMIHTLHLGNRALLIDLSGKLVGVEPQAWRHAEVLAGEPTIDSGNTELFVPQMVNLDLLEGINFNKGCYTGQEIVARMHYLGKLKQRMFVCEIDGNAASGEKITVDNKNAGNIVSVCNTKKIALAVIRRELLTETLLSTSGTHLTIAKQQPYSIPE